VYQAFADLLFLGVRPGRCRADIRIVFEKESIMNLRPVSAIVVLASLAGAAAAQTTAIVSGGRLTLTTTSANQNVKVEMKEAVGVARVFGFSGIADGTTFSGLSGVTVETGAGNDTIEFDVISTVSYDLRVSSGSGSLESQTQWKILPSASTVNANVTYASVAGSLQKVGLTIDNEAANAAISIGTGNASDVDAKILSDDPTAALTVSFHSRAAKTTLELVSAASTLNASIRGAHATSGSEVKYVLNQLRPAAVTLSQDVTLSAGDDKLESVLAAPGSRAMLLGTIRAGAGNDLILLENDTFSTVNGVTLNGGLGNDFLSNKTKGEFQLSQSVGANIFGGPGDDILIQTTDTLIRGTGLPNDVQSIIDGGDGFDLFNAFGFIRNCEGRL
jgi:hypothetical protein